MITYINALVYIRLYTFTAKQFRHQNSFCNYYYHFVTIVYVHRFSIRFFQVSILFDPMCTMYVHVHHYIGIHVLKCRKLNVQHN